MSDVVIEVFFDGACPLCKREVSLLQRMDKHRRIRFTDIAAKDFDATALQIDWQTLMERIHGRLPDGSFVQGVEVFRRMYAAVGFAPLVALTRIPGISHLLEIGYRLFAKNRLKLTGRCTHQSCEVGDHRPGASHTAS